MASKDELLKQQRTLARRPRTNIPSYTMDEKNELNPVSTTTVTEIKPEPIEETPQKAEKLVEPKVEEQKVEKVTEVKTEKLVEEKTEPVAKKKTTPTPKETVVKSVTVRLVDLDDADYLKYACKAKGMNMQEFFWSLIEEDIKSSKKIDPRDTEHIEYKSIALPEIRTIPIPKSLKDKIGVTAGIHRLPETRYMAMVVHRARMSNPAWN